jgi:hypothetical protein
VSPGLAFLALFSILPALGLWVLALPACECTDAAGRTGLAAVAGALGLCLEMFLLSWAGVRWSLPLLGIPVLAAGFVTLAARRPRPASRAAGGPGAAALAAGAAGLLLAAFAAGTARATSPDLLLFWGAKAERFAAVRALDASYLARPEHFLMHSDYPPLLPLLSAAGTLAAGRLPWGATLLLLPVFVLFSALVFWAWAQPILGGRAAGDLAALLTALLGYGLVSASCAGNAEPPLLFFEVAALAGAVFGPARLGTDLFISLALAGAALTKVEGAIFAAIVVLAIAGLARSGKGRLGSFLVLSAAPALTLGAWFLFCRRHGILDAYRGGNMGPLVMRWLPRAARAIASSLGYGAFYLPWLVLAGLWLAGARRDALARKRSFLPLAAGAATALANVFYYLHGDSDPSLWIRWSAERTYLTPLVCLFFAAAAASGASFGKESASGRVRMGLEERRNHESL